MKWPPCHILANDRSGKLKKILTTCDKILKKERRSGYKRIQDKAVDGIGAPSYRNSIFIVSRYCAVSYVSQRGLFLTEKMYRKQIIKQVSKPPKGGEGVPQKQIFLVQNRAFLTHSNLFLAPFDPF